MMKLFFSLFSHWISPLPPLHFSSPRWSREISTMCEEWPPIPHCRTVSTTPMSVSRLENCSPIKSGIQTSYICCWKTAFRGWLHPKKSFSYVDIRKLAELFSITPSAAKGWVRSLCCKLVFSSQTADWWCSWGVFVWDENGFHWI